MKIKEKVLSYTKFEMQILKNPGEYRVCEYDDGNTSYYAFTDGYVMYFIPQNSCHLDIEKFQKRNNMEKFIDKTLNDTCEAAHISDIYKKAIIGVTRKLVSENQTVYVNDKYLKQFANCGFEIIEPMKPIIAKWHWLIVGMIMPLRVDDGERF